MVLLIKICNALISSSTKCYLFDILFHHKKGKIMINTSLWSILFISLPEELFTVLITLASAGYRDVLNFKSRDKVCKLLLSSSIMTLCAITIGLFFSPSLRFVFNAIIFFVIIISVYRFKPLYCIFGFLLSMVILMGSEIIFFPMLMGLLHLSYEQVINSTFYLLLVSMPSRIIQLTALIIVCRIRKFSLKAYKILPTDIPIIAMYFVTLASNMFFIEKNFMISHTSDLITRIKFLSNITIGIGFSFWLIIYLIRLRQKIFIKENIHDVELHHIRQLIAEGEFDHAIKLIDSTLDERGYYSKQ